MDDDFNRQISAALVAFMADHGIEKRAVARELDRSATYVSDRTTGKRDLSVDIVGAVASLSRMSARALVVELGERMARTGSGQGGPSGTGA